MKIALTGGIACGKSLVAKFFNELGVQSLDADDVVHELEAPGGAAVPAIAARFGDSVLAPGGGIDRKRLAEIVFAGGPRITGWPRSCAAADSREARDARRDLEAIIHPLVRRRLLDFAAGRGPRVAIIPLLFESHFESDYDTILCVSSAEDRQIDRMMRTRGYTREQAEARLAAQMPVAEKAARADWTIHNDSTKEALKAEVQRCAAWLSARS
ncbi:MAG: dephospho-CoA kinase [Kiritimatiellae bacterium]|nr:dephospho-CoA kinase [Kiritimatiellia bacterium]